LSTHSTLGGQSRHPCDIRSAVLYGRRGSRGHVNDSGSGSTVITRWPSRCGVRRRVCRVGQGADFLGGYPGFLPGLAASLVVAVFASRPLARALGSGRVLAGALVVSLGLVLSPTLTPSPSGLARDIAGLGPLKLPTESSPRGIACLSSWCTPRSTRPDAGARWARLSWPRRRAASPPGGVRPSSRGASCGASIDPAPILTVDDGCSAGSTTTSTTIGRRRISWPRSGGRSSSSGEPELGA
jgi:hypothetical protein